MHGKLAIFNPIFSKKIDLLIFITPTIIASILILACFRLSFYFPVSFSYENIQIYFYSVYTVFLMVPHSYATFYKVHDDRTMFDGAYQIEFKYFFLLVFFSGIVFFKLPRIFSVVLSYADIFHHVRQQYGWMVLSQRRQLTLSTHESILDKLMIYNVMITPLLWWHFNPTNFGWIQKNDLLFFNSPLCGAITIGIHWIFNLYFFSIYLYWYLKGKQFNLGKILIILSTWFSFYFGILNFEDGVKSLLVTFNHTIPYLFLVYRYIGSPNRLGHKSPRVSNKSWMSFYLPLVFIGLLISSLQFLKIKKLPLLDGGIAFAAVTGGIFHYFFDTFIWRFHRKETRLTEFLDIQGQRFKKLGHQ